MGETVFVGNCTGKQREYDLSKIMDELTRKGMIDAIDKAEVAVTIQGEDEGVRPYWHMNYHGVPFILTVADTEGDYLFIVPSRVFKGKYKGDEVAFCVHGLDGVKKKLDEIIKAIVGEKKREPVVKGGGKNALFEVVSYNHVVGTAKIKVKMGVIKPFLKTDGLLSLRIKNKKAYIGVLGGTLLIERRWGVPVDVDKELRCHIEIPDETEKKLLKMKDEDVTTITFSRQGNASIEVGGVKYDVKENGFDDHATDWREWNKGGECGVSLEEFKNAVDAIVAIQRLNKWSGPTIQLGWLDGLHVATKLDVPEGEEPVVMNISVVCRKPVHDGTYIMYNSEDIKQLFRVEKIKRDKVISVAYAKDTQLLYMETDDYFYVSTPMGDD